MRQSWHLFSFASQGVIITLNSPDILALNTWITERAFSIHSHGGYDKLNFEYGKETEVHLSCSLQWHNHFYVFGGKTDKTTRRQVSMVNGNRLERKATLDFDFQDGGCTVLNKQIIILCFSRKNREGKVCRQSNKPLGLFTKLPDSNYDHHSIRIASFDGKNMIHLKNKSTLN